MIDEIKGCREKKEKRDAKKNLQDFVDRRTKGGSLKKRGQEGKKRFPFCKKWGCEEEGPVVKKTRKNLGGTKASISLGIGRKQAKEGERKRELIWQRRKEKVRRGRQKSQRAN